MVQIAESAKVEEFAVQGPNGGITVKGNRESAEKAAADASEKGGDGHVVVRREVTEWVEV